MDSDAANSDDRDILIAEISRRQIEQQLLTKVQNLDDACNSFAQSVKNYEGGEPLGSDENNPFRDGQGGGCSIQ